MVRFFMLIILMLTYLGVASIDLHLSRIEDAIGAQHRAH